jgi:hypothetical protein
MAAWARPEVREKRSAARERPDVKEKRSAALKAGWARRKARQAEELALPSVRRPGPPRKEATEHVYADTFAIRTYC